MSGYWRSSKYLVCVLSALVAGRFGGGERGSGHISRRERGWALLGVFFLGDEFAIHCQPMHDDRRERVSRMGQDSAIKRDAAPCIPRRHVKCSKAPEGQRKALACVGMTSQVVAVVGFWGPAGRGQTGTLTLHASSFAAGSSDVLLLSSLPS
ncbi:hypothetical protein BKA80DRAFT_101806 [Phyllosticta citrichinensis]